MRGRAVALALTLATTVAGIVVIVVLASRDGLPPDVAPQQGDAVLLGTAIEPERALFGDTIVATAELTVDTTRVDPAKIEIAAFFRPFYRVGDIGLDRIDLGRTLVLRYRYTIQCVVRSCAVGAQSRTFDLPIGLVRYSPREGDVVTLPLSWPALTVLTRLTAADFTGLNARPGGLTTDPGTGRLPDLELRGGPSLIGWLLCGFAALLVLVIGALLAWRLRPRREAAAADERAAVDLPPLDAALVALEATLEGAEGDRRVALDALAARLRDVDSDALAREAQQLAWSRGGPAVDRIALLIGAVRDRAQEGVG